MSPPKPLSLVPPRIPLQHSNPASIIEQILRSTCTVPTRWAQAEQARPSPRPPRASRSKESQPLEGIMLPLTGIPEFSFCSCKPSYICCGRSKTQGVPEQLSLASEPATQVCPDHQSQSPLLPVGNPLPPPGLPPSQPISGSAHAIPQF